MSKWNDGPPPSVGWWPASSNRLDGRYRWWDGRKWSVAAFAPESAEDAAMAATLSCGADQSAIEWKHRPASWPKRSKT